MVPARILPGASSPATNLEANELHINPTMDNIEDLNWGGEEPSGGGPGDNPKEPVVPETPSNFDPTTIIHDIPDGDGMEPGIPDENDDPDNVEVPVNTNEPDNNEIIDIEEDEEAYRVAVRKKNLGLLLLGAAALFLVAKS